VTRRDDEFSPEEAADLLRLRLKVYRGSKEAAAELRERLAGRDAYFRGNTTLREVVDSPSDGQGRLFP